MLKNISCEELNQLKLPISKMATNMTFLGTAISEKDYYSWCISAIEVDGMIHYFVAQWQKELGMAGWFRSGRIAHYIADTPESVPTYFKTIFCDINFQGETSDGCIYLKNYMFAPHNVRVKKIDDQYVLVFIVQTFTEEERIQKIVMATAEDIRGPWTLVGDDGIVLERANKGWTKGSCYGIDNHDVIKIGNEYRIYFKAGLDPIMRKDSRFGYASSTNLVGPYRIKEPVTNNVDYIEDATVFEYNDKVYMLTDDNFGTHCWGSRCDNKSREGYVILWEATPGSYGTEFLIENAKIAAFQLNQYVDLDEEKVQFVRNPNNVNYKFERPSVLMIDDKPAYFIAPACVNIENKPVTNTYLLKIDQFE